jgi:hypothetical protein
MASNYIPNPAALRQLLTSPTGPVAADLLRRGLRVESQAKINASGRPGPNVRTGRLRSSITHRLGVDARGVYVDIGTNVYYGYWVEMGSTRAPPYPYLRPALAAAG